MSAAAHRTRCAGEYSFYEFFAGGGMARVGLGLRWRCVFANDLDPKKAAAYRANWGGDVLVSGDIRSLTVRDLPGQADLAWASFPCQDLSVAGNGAGLQGVRSGAFWPLWELITGLKAQRREPRLIVLENVCGALTAHDGRDFAAICEVLSRQRYHIGAVVVDAVHFVPQSRPRLFIIGVTEELAIASDATSNEPSALFHSLALQHAYQRLDSATRARWLWWRLPTPAARNTTLVSLIEENPFSVPWHTPAQTAALLALMSTGNREKVRTAMQSDNSVIGALYKRTRMELGRKTQRAEIRFDGIAGCLRTSSGGSSRQSLLVIDGDRVRSRLLSAREAARLMGLPDDYKLPARYNEAYHLAGDGVVAPVVRYLAENLLEKLLGPPKLVKADNDAHDLVSTE